MTNTVHVGNIKKMVKMNNVKIALNICTYNREKELRDNLDLLLSSKFFDSKEPDYYGKLHIFIVDNASSLEELQEEFVHLFHNRNTGGAGGYQRGIEEIRKFDDFSHVIFMDDDVSFELSCFYILFDFLKNVTGEDALRPVAGRMFDRNNPSVQYTAAEIWNKGDIEHIEYMRDISDGSYTPGKVIYDSGAEYGGFWFCCYPMDFVRENDIIPFFLHCDDAEYGLRCGRSPIIIEGVHVWHETWEKHFSPSMAYYDTRNPLFVNEKYSLFSDKEEIKTWWLKRTGYHHARKDYRSEYMAIIAMRDYLKGYKWLYELDREKYHQKIKKPFGNRLINAFLWRIIIHKIH